MKKKDTLRNLLSYLPIITLGIGLIVGGTKFHLQAENTKEKINKLEIDTKVDIERIKTDIKEIAKEGDQEIKEIKEKAKDTESKVNINKTQQDNIQAQVQQVSEKTDKIYDVLLELKNKKK